MTLFTLIFHYSSGQIKEYNHLSQVEVNYYISLCSTLGDKYPCNVKAIATVETPISTMIMEKQHQNHLERPHLKLVVTH